MKFSGRDLLFISTCIAAILYLGWRIFFTLPWEYGIPAMVLGLLLLTCEIVAGFESLEQYLNMVDFAEPELPPIPESWYPDVDVFITTHNEDVDLLYKTVNACVHMDYPDKSKVHIYICDDMDRMEMKELAKEFGVKHCGLKNNKHAKSGNLNNGLANSTSPLIATIDADMIPRRHLLMQMIPRFFISKMVKDASGHWRPSEGATGELDEKMGFVQAPQSFYNPDLFQFNLYSEQRVPNEQDYFFREINVGRNRSNSCLYVGSNAVISRKALNEIGGFAINTITEDFETGLRIQSRGYRSYALAKPLANGLAPNTIPGLVAQRERWGRGCIQSLRNVRPFFQDKISMSAKISYLVCLVYWWTFFRRFVYISAPIISALFYIRIVECTLTEIIIFWLPYYLLSNQSLRILSGSTRNQHWNNLIDTVMFPYLIIPIVAETLGITMKKFVVTQKKRVRDKPASNVFFAVPHMFMLAASILALANCLLIVMQTYTLYNIIIMFWLVVNGKNLLFSIFFMLGRQNLRGSERFIVALPVRITHDGYVHKGMTSDISEEGMAVKLSFPVFLPDDEDIPILLDSGEYLSEVKARVQHVDSPRNKDDGWRYCFFVVKPDESNRREFLQIVYDRDHTLAKQILPSLTLYDDFSLNIDKRLSPSLLAANRRLPRIDLGFFAVDSQGRNVMIKDFNYKYAWLSKERPPDDQEFLLTIAPNVTLELKKIAFDAVPRDGGALYQVTNLKNLLRNANFSKALSDWVGSTAPEGW